MMPGRCLHCEHSIFGMGTSEGNTKFAPNKAGKGVGEAAGRNPNSPLS